MRGVGIFPRINFARVNFDGSLDHRLFIPNPIGSVTDTILPLANGSFFVGGGFVAIANTSISHLAFFNANGSLNTTNTAPQANNLGGNAVSAIVMQTDNQSDHRRRFFGGGRLLRRERRAVCLGQHARLHLQRQHRRLGQRDRAVAQRPADPHAGGGRRLGHRHRRPALRLRLQHDRRDQRHRQLRQWCKPTAKSSSAAISRTAAASPATISSA